MVSEHTIFRNNELEISQVHFQEFTWGILNTFKKAEWSVLKLFYIHKTQTMIGILMDINVYFSNKCVNFVWQYNLRGKYESISYVFMVLEKWEKWKREETQ